MNKTRQLELASKEQLAILDRLGSETGWHEHVPPCVFQNAAFTIRKLMEQIFEPEGE